MCAPPPPEAPLKVWGSPSPFFTAQAAVCVPAPLTQPATPAFVQPAWRPAAHSAVAGVPSPAVAFSRVGRQGARPAHGAVLCWRASETRTRSRPEQMTRTLAADTAHHLCDLIAPRVRSLPWALGLSCRDGRQGCTLVWRLHGGLSPCSSGRPSSLPCGGRTQLAVPSFRQPVALSSTFRASPGFPVLSPHASRSSR